MDKEVSGGRVFDSVGLCRDCANRRVVESAKGSVFFLCRLSESDNRYARYPRLPVLSCAGYVAEAKAGTETGH